MDEINQYDKHLRQVGSTPLYDSIFLFVFPPLSLASLASNILAYKVMRARYFQKKDLYTYLRVSCLNSSIINLIYAITFICDSRRFVSIANTQFATYFRCYFKIPLLNLCYFYGCVLDIAVAFDRMIELTMLKHKFRRINSNLICALLGLFCLTVDWSYVLEFEPKSKEIVITYQNQSNRTEIFYYYGKSAFALSFKGQILNKTLLFVRDILTLVILIGLNVATLIRLRFYSNFFWL